VFSAAGGHTVLPITHRSEGLDPFDRVLTLEAGLGADASQPDDSDVTEPYDGEDWAASPGLCGAAATT
jgi:ABC-type transport system involved in cytochrome bd biosynthesis fused ATPase/permease subunit